MSRPTGVPPTTFAVARFSGAALGLVVLGWQGVNAWNGRFVHPFLVADLVAGLVLVAAAVWPGDRGAGLALLAAFAALGGVLLSASTGRWLEGGGFDRGRVLAAVGVVPCAAAVVLLARRLARP